MVKHTTIYIVLEGVKHINIQIFEWLITSSAPALESPNVSCSCSVHGRAHQHVPDAVRTSSSRLEHAWGTGRWREGRKRRREEGGLIHCSVYVIIMLDLSSLKPRLSFPDTSYTKYSNSPSQQSDVTSSSATF